MVPGDVYESLDEARAQVGGIEGNFEPGDGYRTITTPHEGDLQELVATVRDARRQANWVVVTSHTHQGGGNNYIPSRAGDQPGCLGLYQDECNESSYVPADALVTFARATIDAGADAFYAHGPHVLRGIEIYQEKPIFYSLDDFLFQNETPPFQPWDNYARYDVDAFRGLPSDFYDGREVASGAGVPRRTTGGTASWRFRTFATASCTRSGWSRRSWGMDCRARSVAGRLRRQAGTLSGSSRCWPPSRSRSAHLLRSSGMKG